MNTFICQNQSSNSEKTFAKYEEWAGPETLGEKKLTKQVFYIGFANSKNGREDAEFCASILNNLGCLAQVTKKNKTKKHCELQVEITTCQDNQKQDTIRQYLERCYSDANNIYTFIKYFYNYA